MYLTCQFLPVEQKLPNYVDKTSTVPPVNPENFVRIVRTYTSTIATNTSCCR